MSWSYRIKKRNKVALALASIFLIIVFANWFVSYTMTRVSGQFKSVYQDRLVPALDISAVLEHYYQNRQLLEAHIVADKATQKNTIEQLMAANTNVIDSLISKYEATFLTSEEEEYLTGYKAAVKDYTEANLQILKYSRNGYNTEAIKLYKQKEDEVFQQLMIPLHKLISVQQEVGQELYKSAERQVNTIRVLSYLIIGMALVIALLVITLLQTSRKLKSINPQQFHWN